MVVEATGSTGIVADLALPSEVPESHLTPAHASHAALFSLRHKTIAITGAGRGLGITLAAAVLEAGGHVACLDILDAPAAEAWAALQRTAQTAGLQLSYRRVDITDEDDLARVLDEVAAAGAAVGAPFYGAIACAGVQQEMPAVEYPKTDFERIMRVNVTGTFLTAKHSARILIKNGVKGSIVMIASMSGEIANRVSFVSFLMLGGGEREGWRGIPSGLSACVSPASCMNRRLKNQGSSFSNFPIFLFLNRVFRVPHTTQAKPPSIKCAVAWRRNGASTASE